VSVFPVYVTLFHSFLPGTFMQRSCGLLRWSIHNGISSRILKNDMAMSNASYWNQVEGRLPYEIVSYDATLDAASLCSTNTTSINLFIPRESAKFFFGLCHNVERFAVPSHRLCVCVWGGGNWCFIYRLFQSFVRVNTTLFTCTVYFLCNMFRLPTPAIIR
jgi:hypothetical protein